MVMRVIFAGRADPLLDLPFINTYQAAVLLEVMKDFLYQAYVRKGRLQHAMKVRRFFVAGSDAAAADATSSRETEVPRPDARAFSPPSGARSPNMRIPAAVFARAIRPPGILRVAERALGMRHGQRHAAVFVGDRGDAERRAVGIGRVVSGDLAVAFDVARRHQPARPRTPARPRRSRTPRGLRHAPRRWAASSRPCRRGRSTATAAARPARSALRTARRGCARNAASCAAPGMISLSAANIWQPLQTPSVKVSLRSRNRWNCSRARGVIQDGLRPALARAEHVAIRESAAGDEAAEVVELHAAGEDVAHVHVVRFEADALEHRGHLDLAVDALLAQHRHARPRRVRRTARRRLRSDRTSARR